MCPLYCMCVWHFLHIVNEWIFPQLSCLRIKTNLPLNSVSFIFFLPACWIGRLCIWSMRSSWWTISAWIVSYGPVNLLLRSFTLTLFTHTYTFNVKASILDQRRENWNNLKYSFFFQSMTVFFSPNYRKSSVFAINKEKVGYKMKPYQSLMKLVWVSSRRCFVFLISGSIEPMQWRCFIHLFRP